MKNIIKITACLSMLGSTFFYATVADAAMRKLCYFHDKPYTNVLSFQQCPLHPDHFEESTNSLIINKPSKPVPHSDDNESLQTEIPHSEDCYSTILYDDYN